MILIVDYGAGNLRSVVRGLEAVGGSPLLSSDPQKFDDAAGVVFPGQGSFETAMGNNGFELLGLPGDDVIDFGSVGRYKV